MSKIKLLPKEGFKETIFLNPKYDPAILKIDIETGSVIYSLTKLVQIDIEDFENEDGLEYLSTQQELLLFIKDNFCDFFEELQKRTDGIPPTILFDIGDILQSVA